MEEEKDSVQMSQEATVLRTSDESVLDGEDRQTTMDQQPEKSVSEIVDEPRKQLDTMQIPDGKNKIIIQPATAYC